MIEKVLKIVWFFSVLSFMGVGAYVYASLGVQVKIINWDMITKVQFFYGSVLSVAFINLIIYMLRPLPPNSWLRPWIVGLIALINLFVMVIMIFILITNSGETFHYVRVNPMLFGSFGLLVSWVLGGVFYFFWKSFYSKKQESNDL